MLVTSKGRALKLKFHLFFFLTFHLNGGFGGGACLMHVCIGYMLFFVAWCGPIVGDCFDVTPQITA